MGETPGLALGYEEINMPIGVFLAFRLFRIARLLLALAVVFLLVTAIADISLAPSDSNASTPADAAASADVRRGSTDGEQVPRVSVIAHEGGVGEVDTWVTEKVDGTLSAIEDARLETRSVLTRLGDLIGL